MSDWTKEDYEHVREDLKRSGFFLPVKKGKLEALGWIADIPLGFDLLQPVRENPLFEKWNCKHTHELKQRIEANADLLKGIREKQRLQIFKNLSKCGTQQEKRALLGNCLGVIDTQPLSDWLDDLRSKLKEERDELNKNLQPESNEYQIGRPEDFDSEKSLKWYNELKGKTEYQHKNGNPYKTKIRKEIIERHTRIENAQEIKPSMRTIERHTS